MPAAKLQKMRNAYSTATLVSLDASMSSTRSCKMGEGEDLRLIDSVSSTLPSPLEVALYQGLRTELANSIQTLEPAERDILRMRLGVDGGSTMTRAEVGSRFSLHAKEIARIEKNALAKLQFRVNRDWLDFDRDLESSTQRRRAVGFIC